jgi:hypothetical protein
MNIIKRPLSVWITQILLVVFGLLLLLTLLMDIAMVLTHLNETSVLIPTLVVFAVMFAILVLFAGSFFGMLKARAYGRWLAVLSMVLVWAFILLAQLRRPSGPFKYYEYDNRAQVVGAIFAQLLLHGLFLTLILRLAFARKVGAFFRGTQPNKSLDASGGGVFLN